MKTKEEKIEEIRRVVNNYSRVSKRVAALTKLGYSCAEHRCGSSGNGQVIELKNEIKVQIGYNHRTGFVTYAIVVI